MQKDTLNHKAVGVDVRNITCIDGGFKHYDVLN